MPDEDLPGQKREPEFWLNNSAIKRAIKRDIDREWEEKYCTDEYSTFNPDATPSSGTSDSLDCSRNDSFPLPLHPAFDLHAIVTVNYRPETQNFKNGLI